ncbi:MAG: 4'-phosphopantetheinyl transferase superfamily protein [Oscillospiraceae bacterium]|nr:4'-phosphopantetheinyl transferase superfamily protein [Oscillospiraceae bacterium]
MELKWKRLRNQTGHDAGRELLAALYRKKTGCEIPPIFYTEQGKPYFSEGDWHFSISHTDRHGFCCLSRVNVGIDAEAMDRKIDPRLAGRYLSEKEQKSVENASDQNAALLRLWVLKEAYAKLTGRGIGNWLKGTDFDPEDSRITCIDGCFVAILEGEK